MVKRIKINHFIRLIQYVMANGNGNVIDHLHARYTWENGNQMYYSNYRLKH